MKEETVALWLGMTFGKIRTADPYAGTGYGEWLEDRHILATCTARALSMPRCEGVAFFSYRHVFDPVSGARVERTYEESEAVFSQFTSTIPHE